jgi:hypothetical protein
VVEVVVGREELDVGEVLGRLEDAGDLEAGLGGVVERGGRGAAGEALKLDRAAGIEEEKGRWHRLGEPALVEIRLTRTFTPGYILSL